MKSDLANGFVSSVIKGFTGVNGIPGRSPPSAGSAVLCGTFCSRTFRTTRKLTTRTTSTTASEATHPAAITKASGPLVGLVQTAAATAGVAAGVAGEVAAVADRIFMYLAQRFSHNFTSERVVREQGCQQGTHSSVRGHNTLPSRRTSVDHHS